MRSLSLGAGALVTLSLLGCEHAADRVEHRSQEGASRTSWTDRGYVQLVPAIRPPTSADGNDVIEVWIMLPPGGALTLAGVPASPRLRLPVGSRLDRIELLAKGPDARVEDVRGTELRADGQVFHVDEPSGPSKLEGVAWKRGDPTAQAEADAAFAALLARTGEKRGNIERLVALNQCASCHVFDKPPSRRAGEGGLPNRPTDGTGFYEILAVLSDASPLESARPHDPNLDDPFITITCGASGEAPIVTRAADGATSARCAEGTPPRARLDVVRALASHDAHAEAVCASRRYLFDHMDVGARRAFEPSFDECQMSTEGTSK